MAHHFTSSPIAIVGMACRLPGAGDLEEYWELLRAGRSAIAELPPDRLNRELYYDPAVGVLGKTYSCLGGLIPDGTVDPRKLGLAPAVAAATDIAHLIICDVAAEALRHARMDPFHLANRNAGVYIGAAGGSPWAGQNVFSTLIAGTAAYLRELPAFQSPQSGQLGKGFIEEVVAEVAREVRRQYERRPPGVEPNLGAHVAAGIITQAFGLNGPHMAIDAACASSLQSLLLGVYALQQGRVEMAIVGGASYSRSDTLVLFSHAQSVSARGSCPFDADADGLVPSEGYVAMILKTLPRALQDGDPICAVIRGVGMSTDGRGKSLWAPRKEGQIAAIARAYPEGLNISQVQYVEAHATSTQVGDATELTALCEALASLPPPSRRIALGSAKGNIGHSLETAGIAGLTKAVLALQHAVIPPSINIQKLNPRIEWDRIPFFVPREPLEWADNAGRPRRAAVNAFGVGGLNVHVVVDEFVKTQPKTFYFSEPAPGAIRADPEPIAVIGLGAIYPGARTLEQFWELLRSGADAKGDAPADRWNKEVSRQPGPPVRGMTPGCLGGFIRDYEYDWRKNKIPPKQVAQANPLQFMLLDAADQALQHAGYDRRPFDRARVGVVVGTVFSGDFQDQLQMGLRLPEFNVILTAILRNKGLAEDQIAAVVEQYRELFFQRMPALMDETGSFTSSTLASRITKTFDLMGGAFALDAGAGSGLAAISSAMDVLRSGDCDMMICAAGQRSMDWFSYDGLSRDGTLAEGHPGPAFDAATRGIVPGEGVGVVLLKRLSDARRDGDPIRVVLRSVGISSDFRNPARAHQNALRQALQMARVSPRQMAVIETSGGVPEQDAAELDAVAEVLKESPPSQPVLLGSVVGQIGFCGAASGMASMLKTAMACERQHLPVGMKVTNPSPAVVKHQGLLALPQAPGPFLPNGADARLIGVTSGCSLGQSFFAICQHGDEAPATTGAGLPRAATGVTDVRPRVAWMFVGQGSQYAGMLQPLINEFPPAAAAMKRANEVLARWGCGSFADLAWHNPTGLGSEVWETQIATLIADYILAESLFALGVRPDVVAGHSFGEIPALIAAGSWSLETAVQCLRLRTEALGAVGAEPGSMAAVSAPVDVVQKLVAQAQSAGLLYIANHNAPEQIVLSGQLTAIARVVDLAKQAGLNAVRLPVPCAFHSPMMSPAAQVFAAGLPAIPIRAARVPVLSTAFHRYMIEEEDIRRSLREQFTQPVRYVDMVRKLAGDHPTVFVEVGPQRVLTRLHTKILDGKPLGAVSSDDSQRPGLEQLWSVIAVLRSCGVTVAEEPSASSPGLQPIAARPAPAARSARLVHHDATARRRQHRREQAVQSAHGLASHPEPAAGPLTAGPEEGGNGNGEQPAGGATVPGTGPAGESLAALKSFMVQFIVEQTGYPEEMVDVDANLEADLGIDSIKKAQLFGEIRERFRVLPPAGNVTLDDFPTLRHVLDFLVRGTVEKAEPAATEGDGDSRPATAASGTDAPSIRPVTSSETGRQMSRFVLRMVAAPRDPAGPKAAGSARVLILGDNPDAAAVRDQLQRRGQEVLLLGAPADPAAAVAALERAWKDGPVPDLWLMTPRDGEPMPYGDEQAWNRRRARGVLVPYVLCQKWFERATAVAGDLRPTLVAVTALGGDLGFGGDLASAEGGGLAGLAKAVGAEAPGRVRVKVVDFPSQYSPGDLAVDVINEVAADTTDVEIGYDAARQRHLVRARLEPASSLPPRAVRSGSTWVVTGGARGVTAHVARELGHRFQLKLHLLGTSPVPQIDPGWRQLSADGRKQLRAQVAKEARQKGEDPTVAWQRIERAIELDQSLRRFADQGVQARYHPCDVANRVRLAEVLDEIRRTDGPIEGVIHGAGVENACKFASKRLELVSRAIAAKVDGAAALMALLQDAPPKFLVGFGSVSGRFGGVGQTDYSLANDMLCKLVAQFRRQHPDCAAVCLDWTAWAEVGMAARPESRFALEAMKVRFMSPAEGVDHVLDELQRTGTDAEVLIVDPSSSFSSHTIVESAAKGNGETPASPAPAPVNDAQYRAGYQYGREHRHEILRYLREFADRFPQGNAPAALRPEAMRRVADATTEIELRGLAAGAEVALVSLLAHNEAVRTGRGTPSVAPARAGFLDVADWPMLEDARSDRSSEELVATVAFHPQSDVFLREHTIYGQPVLPAVISAEIAAEAGSLLCPERRWIGIANLELVNRYDFAADTPVRMEVGVRAQSDGAQCELTVPKHRDQAAARIVVARAVARFAEAPLTPVSMPVGEPPSGWTAFQYTDERRLVWHGPSLRALREVAFHGDGGWGRLVAPAPGQLAGDRRGPKWLVPSALLDGCLVACSTYAYFMVEQRVELPRQIGELLVYRQPRENESCRLRLLSRHSDSRGSRYDFHVVGEDGLAVLAVRDYTTICFKRGKV